MRVVLPVILVLGACNIQPSDPWLRTRWTEQEIRKVDRNELKAGVINDVRTQRMLRHRLDEGRRSCPEVRFENGTPVCATHESVLERFIIRRDPAYKPNRVEETAYYCTKEFHYSYHYRGGPEGRDVWLGPFSLKRERSKPPGD